MFKDKIYGMLTPETKRIIQEFREEPLRKVVILPLMEMICIICWQFVI